MSGAFGFEETKDMNGQETFEYFRDELKMAEPDAWERTLEQGKDPSGKKDENSKFKKDKNFVTRATLSEIQKQKMIKVVEDILMGKKNSNNSEVTKKKNDEEIPSFLKKNMKSLIKQMEKQGFSKKDLIKMLSSE
jgi:DNA-binding transcriptional regulator YhcF (GntR family)